MEFKTCHLVALLFATSVASHIFADDQAAEKPNNSVTLDLSHPREVQPVGKNSWGGVNPHGDRLTVTSQSIELNGKPLILVAGEMHPGRTDEAAWEESILKMKAGGLNTVSFYILWNAIEPDPGQFDFTGNRNIRKFVELCAKHGMYVWLRPGPFCNSESLAGGLPQWLFGEPVNERSNDPGYLSYVARLFWEIGQQLHGLMFRDGGPVIAIQLENEYAHATPYWEFPYPGAGGGNRGSDGESHMMKLKELATQGGLIAPLYTCTAWGGAPVPIGEFLPTYGCYSFLGNTGPTVASTFPDYRNELPEKSQYPLAFCELGGGSPPQAGWRPAIPPESVEASLFTRVAVGGSITAIYMYHGGINPLGKHGYLNVSPGFNTMSYDFQAPIGEFGRIKPSFYQTRPFQQFLCDFPDLLVPTVPVWEGKTVEPGNTTDLRYIARTNGDSGFLFLSNFQDKLVLPDRTGVRAELKLKNETLFIPEMASGLVLKSGVMAALPFNLTMEGARLKYATAQLMSKVDCNGHRMFVFFSPIGMATEFVFDAAGVKQIEGIPAVPSGSTLKVSVAEPGTGAKFVVTPANGTAFSVLVLTRRQAEHCLKLKDLWGAESLVLSEDDLMSDGETLRVSAVGTANLSFSIFPKPNWELTGPTGLLAGIPEGVFTRYALALPKCEIKANVQNVTNEKVLVKVCKAEFENANDIFLRVDYLGDRGWAFIDGTLVADNFNHGIPWEIGLKRWRADMEGKGLFLRIIPWRGDTTNLLFDGITYKSVENASEPAAIRSAQLIPEYAATIRTVPKVTQERPLPSPQTPGLP